MPPFVWFLRYKVLLLSDKLSHLTKKKKTINKNPLSYLLIDLSLPWQLQGRCRTYVTVILHRTFNWLTAYKCKKWLVVCLFSISYIWLCGSGVLGVSRPLEALVSSIVRRCGQHARDSRQSIWLPVVGGSQPIEAPGQGCWNISLENITNNKWIAWMNKSNLLLLNDKDICCRSIQHNCGLDI